VCTCVRLLVWSVVGIEGKSTWYRVLVKYIGPTLDRQTDEQYKKVNKNSNAEERT
jgi:hypothetical protein